MSTVIYLAPELDEEVWRAWLEKGRLSEIAAAKRAKVVGGIILALVVSGGLFYRIVVM